jgi:hypothetical protein
MNPTILIKAVLLTAITSTMTVKSADDFVFLQDIRKLRHVRTLIQRNHNFTFPWPVKRVATITGDLTIGALMMVHEREDLIICGPIMPQGGIQALETMLYTIDYVNSIKDFIPGVRIGAYILDDCDKDTYGLEQAVDFVKGQLSLFFIFLHCCISYPAAVGRWVLIAISCNKSFIITCTETEAAGLLFSISIYI